MHVYKRMEDFLKKEIIKQQNKGGCITEAWISEVVKRIRRAGME